MNLSDKTEDIAQTLQDVTEEAMDAAFTLIYDKMGELKLKYPELAEAIDNFDIQILMAARPGTSDTRDAAHEVTRELDDASNLDIDDEGFAEFCSNDDEYMEFVREGNFTDEREEAMFDRLRTMYANTGGEYRDEA